MFAGAADALLDAVARTLAALSPVATFDCRTVSTEVRRVRGLRDVEFDTDTASGSGTAFHHAIETVVDDIEARDDTRTVVIGFTDGRDFASRNFHPEFGSDDQVLRHVTARLRRLRASRPAAGGDEKGFELHIASLGADIDVVALDALAGASGGAGGGRHVSSADAGALEAAFGQLHRRSARAVPARVQLAAARGRRRAGARGTRGESLGSRVVALPPPDRPRPVTGSSRCRAVTVPLRAFATIRAARFDRPALPPTRRPPTPLHA